MSIGSMIGPEILKQPIRLDNTSFKLQAGSRYYVGGKSVTLDSDTIVTASTSLDTGSLTANTLYYVYVVLSGGVVSVKLSLSAVSPVGYAAYKNIGYIYTDGSSYLLPWQGTITSLTFTQVNALTGNLGLGTYTAGSVEWLQTKDGLLYYKGKLTLGGGAGVSASEARIPYPNGFISADTTKIPNINAVGTLYRNMPSIENLFSVLVEPSVGYFTVGKVANSGTPLTKITGAAMVANGETVSFNFTVPVQGIPSTPQWLTNVVG